jgi:hemolysin D
MPLLKLMKFDRAANGDQSRAERSRASRSAPLTALEQEFLPHLLEIQESPPSPAHRKVMWSIVLLVLVLIGWACIGQIAVVATAPGKFIPDGRIKQIQPLEASIIKAIHVQEGQHVHAGDLLLELDPGISGAALQANTDKYAYNRLEQTRLAAELTHDAPDYRNADPAWVALQESARAAREAAYTAKREQARSQVEEKAHALAAAQATLTKYRENTAISEERESSARPLVETGAVSRVDYLQLKQELTSNRNDFVAQTKTVDERRAALQEAQKHLAEVEHDHKAAVYGQLGEKMANEPGLRGDMEKSRELHELKWLKAPVNGWVQKMNVTTVGGVVNPAQTLMTIVPDGMPLVVEALLSNDDIGYVKVGQPVELKVDTFPFQKYGTLKGSLVWVSPDAEERSTASISDENGAAGNQPEKAIQNVKSVKEGYVYKVRIRPEQSAFVVDGRFAPLQAGMTVQADIATDRRRVIDFVISPLIKYMGESASLR